MVQGLSVRIYRSMGRLTADPLILMARQHGLDQSHMDVNEAREFFSTAVMLPE